eukprot:747534-Hanusia_phi.AAC.6
MRPCDCIKVKRRYRCHPSAPIDPRSSSPSCEIVLLLSSSCKCQAISGVMLVYKGSEGSWHEKRMSAGRVVADYNGLRKPHIYGMP